MTKKDYEAIAGCMKEVHKSNEIAYNYVCTNFPRKKIEAQKDYEVSENILKGVIYSLASTFARDNTRFDLDRFLKACGIED